MVDLKLEEIKKEFIDTWGSDFGPDEKISEEILFKKIGEYLADLDDGFDEDNLNNDSLWYYETHLGFIHEKVASLNHIHQYNETHDEKIDLNEW